MAWTFFRKPYRRWGPAGATAVALAGVALIAVAGAPARPASAAAGCQASYSISSQWSGGFSANVSITNLGSPVTSWTATWMFSGNQQITQIWNATDTASGENVTATNVSYNGSVATNASVTFGFNGSVSGTNAAPAQLSFNGTACTGSVTPTPTPTPTPP